MAERRPNTVYENLEQVEIARLRLKYEMEGYHFKSNFNKKTKTGFIDIDAYAKNPKTGDEVIFEVKARQNLKKYYRDLLIARRTVLLNLFPRARFVLVLAELPKRSTFEDSVLNELILEFIIRQGQDKFPSSISQIQPVGVESITIDKIDFNDFEKINIIGNGNFTFFHLISNPQFVGYTRSDGIPFQFDIVLENTFERKTPFVLLPSSRIDFDFSEFIVNDEDNLKNE